MSDDYIRPDRSDRLQRRRRFDRGDARLTRRQRGRVLFGVSLVAFFVVAYNFGPIKPALRDRAAARRAAALTSKPVSKPTPFTTVSGTPLALALPAPPSDIISIGYHQAYNRRALSLVSKTQLMSQATSQTVKAAVGSGHSPAFVMEARGRGSALDSSVDIALKTGSVVKSPVTGRVVAVTPYLLYGRINDVRIEIVADDFPGFKLALVHIDKPAVAVGQRVKAGLTPLANVRSLGISSQIDQYLGKAVAHVHIQANPIEAKPAAANAD